MPRTRFQLLSAFIRFDDYQTRDHRRETDKLAPIRDIFNIFVENCKKSYQPNINLTVDEQLVSFRGRCSFRVYMKSKPVRYGIKIWALSDSENAYSLNLQVYLGKTGNTAEKNQGQRVVMDLVECLGTGYGITTDNFFTSMPLADSLIQKQLSLCGTLRQNKACIPHELLPSKERPPYSSIFAFSKMHTLVSYAPAKNKAVVLLSTEHHDNSISGEQTNYKPDMVLHYNKTKGAVDTTDKMAKQYSARRSSNRWPVVLFGHLIDLAGINAFRLWEIKFPEKKSKSLDDRKKFILNLGHQLVKENIIQRYKMRRILHYNKTIIQHMTNVVPELDESVIEEINQEQEQQGDVGNAEGENMDKGKGRCYLCTRNRDRKSRQSCSKCSKFVCRAHSEKMTICVECNRNRDDN